LPHHITQRGNGSAKVFFTPGDYTLYKTLLVEHCRAANVGIWAWCLMPNHVHLILTPADPDGLRRALAKVHCAYAGTIHARQKKTGYSGKAASAPSRRTRTTSCRRCAMSD
ncbi:transposase, partial [Mesorhizobium intechi]|uniref:transposase n=1 Tax=Mesorhizobium intechi TaxID=537601 RepID=UPI001FEB8064